MKHLIWAEKYRPQTVAACILPDRIKKIFQEYATKKEIPHLLLHGSPGTGKTSMAMALCDEVGADYMFINGSEENGIDTLRTKIRSYASTISINGGRKVIIIDEADYMNPNSLQPGLRSAIEEFSKNCSFILTCNNKKRIIDALHSRCPDIEFKLVNGEKAKMAGEFMKAIESILTLENVPFERKVIAALITKFFPDFRRTINQLQKYAQNGKIDEGILTQLTDVDLKELVIFLKEKEFTKVQKWVKTNSDNDPNSIYRSIYNALAEFLQPASVPQIILTLAKYQYQAAYAADPEIQLIACLVEVMIDGQFK